MKRLISMILVIMMVIFVCGAAHAEPALLKVRGSGVVSVTADTVRVVLGVRESVADVREAQATVNEKINAIYAALTEAGVDGKDIATESIYIYANYDYSESEERLVGYTASNNISISTSEIDKMGEYIDIAFAAGANSLDGVYFSSRESGEAQKEALELAVANAFEKAEVIAKAAEMRIVAVTMFDETNQQGSDNEMTAKYSNARMEAAASDASTMVQASSLQIKASVLVEFELGAIANEKIVEAPIASVPAVEIQPAEQTKAIQDGANPSVETDEGEDKEWKE